MKRTAMAAAVGLLACLALNADPARADILSDVEVARTNARAGGPIDAHDAELLRRWGALSGTFRRYPPPPAYYGYGYPDAYYLGPRPYYGYGYPAPYLVAPGR